MLQIQLCGTITDASPEFAERAAHGCDDIIQAFKARDTPRAADALELARLMPPDVCISANA
jgi:hypothetical protein